MGLASNSKLFCSMLTIVPCFVLADENARFVFAPQDVNDCLTRKDDEPTDSC